MNCHQLYSWLHDSERSTAGTIQLAKVLKCRAPTTDMHNCGYNLPVFLLELGSKCKPLRRKTSKGNEDTIVSVPILRCLSSFKLSVRHECPGQMGFCSISCKGSDYSPFQQPQDTHTLFQVIHKPFWKVPRTTRAPNKCLTILSQIKYVNIWWVSYSSNE